MLQIIPKCSFEPEKVVVGTEKVVKTGVGQSQIADISSMDLTRDLKKNLWRKRQKGVSL